MLHGTHDQVHISHLQHQEITLCDRPCPNLQFMIGSYFPTTKKTFSHFSQNISKSCWFVLQGVAKQMLQIICEDIFAPRELFTQQNKTKGTQTSSDDKEKRKSFIFLAFVIG